MIGVYKTNVGDPFQANAIRESLMDQYVDLRINFDLEDCDRILRVEGERFCEDEIIDSVNSLGFECSILV